MCQGGGQCDPKQMKLTSGQKTFCVHNARAWDHEPSQREKNLHRHVLIQLSRNGTFFGWWWQSITKPCFEGFVGCGGREMEVWTVVRTVEHGQTGVIWHPNTLHHPPLSKPIKQTWHSNDTSKMTFWWGAYFCGGGKVPKNYQLQNQLYAPIVKLQRQTISNTK